MKLILIFDINADLVDVPEYVILNKELLQKNFLKWIYNKNNKHGYWVLIKDHVSGNKFWGLKYRGDAFVEWLNKKVLTAEKGKASFLESSICITDNDIPSLYF